MTQVIKIKRSTGSAAPATLAQGELAYSKGSDTFFIGDPATANTPIPIGPAIKNNLGTPELGGSITAAQIRTLIGVDAAGSDNSTDVTLNAAVTDVLSISAGQELSAVDNGSDALVGWDDSAGKITYLSAADVRAAINVDPAGTDNSTDQNLWATISSDSGSTTANTLTDTLTVSGAGATSTAIVGDTLTITSTDANVDVSVLQTRLGQISTATTVGTGENADFTFASDVTVQGNLTVQGTLTSISTANTEITDNTILLNQGESGAEVSNGTSGLEIDRGTGTNVSFLWNDNTDRWTFTNDGSTFRNLLVPGEYIDQVQVTSTDGSITGVGTATPNVTGDVSFNLQVGTIDGGVYP